MLPANMSNTWIFSHFVGYLAQRYDGIRGVIEEYAERQDEEFDKNIAGPALIEMIWSLLQSYRDTPTPRTPGWQRRVMSGWPDAKAHANLMAHEMRLDSVELWRMGASRESSELIRAAEAARQLSNLTLNFADGNTASCDVALKQIANTCPQIDYEFNRVFAHWNEMASAVVQQGVRQTLVFTDPKAPLKDD